MILGARVSSDHRVEDWERSEWLSFRIALAIALLPIPASLLISWALGSPPWVPRPMEKPANEAQVQAPPSHEGGDEPR